MTKNLSKRIAERVIRKKPSRRAQNRANFLALREEVKQALDDGWPIKTIWETLYDEKKIFFQYQAFRRYVNSLILSPPSYEKTMSNSKKKDYSETAAQKKETPNIGGFNYNPTPNKKNLF